MYGLSWTGHLGDTSGPCHHPLFLGKPKFVGTVWQPGREAVWSFCLPPGDRVSSAAPSCLQGDSSAVVSSMAEGSREQGSPGHIHLFIASAGCKVSGLFQL